MDISHAANYFNTMLLDVWNPAVSVESSPSDLWVTNNRPKGRLLASDRDQTYSASPRWRTLLVEAPLKTKAIRVGGTAGQVYLVGNPDTDFDTSRYSLAYPVYKADSLAMIYTDNPVPPVDSDRLAQRPNRDVITRIMYPCALDKSGTVSSSLFDEVRFTEATIVLPDALNVELNVRHELMVDYAFYAVREAYKANGFVIVKGLRKKQ